MPEASLNLSRGCGNPTGFANIQPGDVVVDLGCGGGIDVILAAQKVGERGKVIAVDFAPQMLDHARKAVTDAGLHNRDIEFINSSLEDIQIKSNLANIVISNCVINLCPDKTAVYREAFRILQPGGKLAISDILFKDNIDAELRNRFQTNWAGCLGGAIAEDDYWQIMKENGFYQVKVILRHTLTPKELEALACCPSKEFTPAPSSEDLAVVQGNVTSVKFTAFKKDNF